MRVLMLTYPLAPVAADACGGTEQMAYHLLRGLAESPEFELEWVGAEGSEVQARRPRLLAWRSLLRRHRLLRPPPRAYSPEALADLEARCNQAVLRHLRQASVDLIHNQGAPFPWVAAAVATPVLFTVHLARRLYPAAWPAGPKLHVQCVSQSQRRGYGAAACCGVIGNGIDLAAFPPRRASPPGAPLLYLGRMCPEKGPHLAIQIARQARRRLWLVGAVAPFPDHQRYFATRIAPFLNADVRWLPPPTPARKRALLAAAAAVVIPSQVEEPSSVVAMEAAAAGVPALALRRGALPEVVAHGESGWLAEDWEALAEWVPRLAAIAPSACRARAERCFGAAAMVAAYRRLYRQLGAAANPGPPTA